MKNVILYLGVLGLFTAAPMVSSADVSPGVIGVTPIGGDISVADANNVILDFVLINTSYRDVTIDSMNFSFASSRILSLKRVAIKDLMGRRLSIGPNDKVILPGSYVTDIKLRRHVVIPSHSSLQMQMNAFVENFTPVAHVVEIRLNWVNVIGSELDRAGFPAIWLLPTANG